MGNPSSKPLSPEEKRKRELAEKGVLIPPSFGVGTDVVLPPSSAANLIPYYPYSMETLREELPCKRLLGDEHMTPGLWVSAATPSLGSVLASCNSSNEGSYEGMLCASQAFSKGQIDVCAHSHMASPCVSAYYSLWPGCQLHSTGTIHAKGTVWFGCHVDTDLMSLVNKATKPQQEEYYRNNPFQDESAENEEAPVKLKLGSWVQLRATTNVKGSFGQVARDSIQNVNGFAALETKDCTVAAEASVPLSLQTSPQLSYLTSFNLNAASDGPSLVVTLEKTPSESSMNLSQLLTFDRYVGNILEERCPKIRNTLAWSVQLAQGTANSQPSTQLSAALAWQLNRGLCLKVLASPTSNRLTAGILLKRWKEPRVSCSLLFGSLGNGQGVGFQGIGVELETGPVLSGRSSKDNIYYEDTDGHAQVVGDTPPTKATLPSEN